MLDNHIKLSLIIPTKNRRSQRLRELLLALESQDFPKQNLEILVESEGTSESAKAIGIRRASGEVVCIMATDNLVNQDYKTFLSTGYRFAMEYGSAYPAYYGYASKLPVIDRYFALIGGNDPLAFYMGKNDRGNFLSQSIEPHDEMTFGDNGFFIKRDIILQSDLDNYYHVDNVYDVRHLTTPFAIPMPIFHLSGGRGLINFMFKRYRYGLQHAFNPNRRWHLVDFEKPKDIWRLAWFVLASLTLLQPLYLSVKGFLKRPDVAWFLHPVICLLTVLTYSVLILHIGLRRFRSSFVPMVAQRA